MCRLIGKFRFSGRLIAKKLRLPRKTMARVIKSFTQSQSIEQKPETGQKSDPRK
jgi:hypothetical protein